MVRVVIVALLASTLGGAWYLSEAGVGAESQDTKSVRTGSAGSGAYYAGSVK